MADTDYPEPNALRTNSMGPAPALVSQGSSPALPAAAGPSVIGDIPNNAVSAVAQGTKALGAASAAAPAATTAVDTGAGVLRGAMGQYGQKLADLANGPAITALRNNPIVQNGATALGAMNVGTNVADATDSLRQGNYGDAAVSGLKAGAGTAAVLGGDVAAPLGLAVGAGASAGTAIHNGLVSNPTGLRVNDAIGSGVNSVVQAVKGNQPDGTAAAPFDPHAMAMNQLRQPVGAPPSQVPAGVQSFETGTPTQAVAAGPGAVPPVSAGGTPPPVVPPPVAAAVPGNQAPNPDTQFPTGVDNVPGAGSTFRIGNSFSDGSTGDGNDKVGFVGGGVSSDDRIGQMQRDSAQTTDLSLRKQQADDMNNGVASAPGGVIMDGSAADAQRRQDFFDLANAHTADSKNNGAFTSLRGAGRLGSVGGNGTANADAVNQRISDRNSKQQEATIQQQDNLLRNRTTQRGQDMDLASHRLTSATTARGQDLDFAGKQMETGQRIAVAQQEAARANRAFERDTNNDTVSQTAEAVKARSAAEDKLNSRYAAQLPPVKGPDGKMGPDTVGAARYTQAAVAGQAARVQQLQQELAAAPNDPNAAARQAELSSIQHYGVDAMGADAQTKHFASMRAADLRNQVASSPSAFGGLGAVANRYMGSRPMETTTGPASMTLRKRSMAPNVYDLHGPNGEDQGSIPAYAVDNGGNMVLPGIQNKTFDTLKSRPVR